MQYISDIFQLIIRNSSCVTTCLLSLLIHIINTIIMDLDVIKRNSVKKKTFVATTAFKHVVHVQTIVF